SRTWVSPLLAPPAGGREAPYNDVSRDLSGKKPPLVRDGTPHRNRFNVCDVANDFKVHGDAFYQLPLKIPSKHRTLGVRRGGQRERGTSGRWQPSPARRCSAGLKTDPVPLLVLASPQGRPQAGIYPQTCA